MRLYLVQHGKAKDEEEDPDRPLTEEGRTEVGEVARRAAASGEMELGRILHSGKTRARQTAELVAEAAGGTEVGQDDDLGPTDDVGVWAGRLRAAAGELGDRGLMLVGHLPYVERMAGRLVTGDAERPAVRFRKGGILCLEHDEEGRAGWVVRWYLTPELA